MTILGICGRKRQGKDTFGRMLIERMPSFLRLSFAARLKEICTKVYGLNSAQVEDEAAKDMLLSGPVELDGRLDVLQREIGLDLRPLGLVAKTPRQVLQLVGTDYVRAADPRYWVETVDMQILASKGDVVVTDVRFANEAEMIRSRGGKVLRVLRLSSEQKAEHSSEALDFDPDFTLAVGEGDFGLSRFILDAAVRDRSVLFPMLAAANWDMQAAMLPLLAAYYRPILPQMIEALLEAAK